MVYIDNQGRVLDSRPFGLATVSDFFMGLITFFSLFFRTLVNPDLNQKGDQYATDYRSTGGRGPRPPGPRRRFGGFGPSGGGPSPPPMRGGG